MTFVLQGVEKLITLRRYCFLCVLIKMLGKREGAKGFNILCNILRREKIEDFQQGIGIFFT